MKKLILIAAAFTSACVSTGVKVDHTKLEDFHKGKTTYSDVVAALGQPTQTMYSDNGTKTIVYAYMSGQPRPESFIPFVGPLVGGADIETSSVNMDFDTKGTLVSMSSTQGAMGGGTGFQAISQPRNSNQPRKQP